MPRPSRPRSADSSVDRSTTFFADAFTLSLGPDWESTTVYQLKGPHLDDFQHTIQITVDPDVEDPAVGDYAAQRVEQKMASLREGRVLHQTRKQLDNGRPAYWVLFSVQPPDGEPRYQEDCYVVEQGVGYQLSAQFTPETRSKMAPVVRSIFDRFSPQLPLRRRR